MQITGQKPVVGAHAVGVVAASLAFTLLSCGRTSLDTPLERALEPSAAVELKGLVFEYELAEHKYLFEGQSTRFKVIGVYSNRSRRDLTFDPNTVVTIIPAGKGPNLKPPEAIVALGDSAQEGYRTATGLAEGEVILRGDHTHTAGKHRKTFTYRDRIIVDGLKMAGLAFKPDEVLIEQGTVAEIEVSASFEGTDRKLNLVSTQFGTKLASDNPEVAVVQPHVVPKPKENGQESAPPKERDKVRVLGVGLGSTTVRATNGGFTATAAVTVYRRGEVRLRGIATDATEVKMVPGQRYQLSVLGFYTDGATKDLTADPATSYVAADESLATVSAKGEIRARATGETAITVAHGEFTREVRVVISRRVLPDKLTEIRFDPETAALQPGETITLKLLGYFADGSIFDVIYEPEAVVSTDSPADVDYMGDGLLAASSAATPGVYTVMGAYQGFTTTMTVEVLQTGVTLVSAYIEPPFVSLAIGESQQFALWGAYSDGSSRDLTGDPRSSWRSGAPEKVEISSNGYANVLSGKLGDQVTITASHQGFEAYAQVYVETGIDAQLESITVVPQVLALRSGESSGFNVLANYSDGSVQDITFDGELGWSYDSGFLYVEAGFVQALEIKAPTATEVAFFYRGFETVLGIDLRANNAELVALTVTPNPLTVVAGKTAQLTVTGTYSDGSSADLTAASAGTSYESEDFFIADVGPNGEVFGNNRGGPLNIWVYNGFLAANVQVTVLSGDPNELTALAVAPAVATITAADTVQLKITGTMGDGSTRDLTLGATGTTYVTSNPDIPVNGDGLVKPTKAGNASITALNQGFTAVANITVLPAGVTLTGLVLEPAKGQVAVKSGAQLKVTGTYSDGSKADLTKGAGTTYSSANTAILTVDKDGVVNGIAAGGPVTITATNSNLSATASFTVFGDNVFLDWVEIVPSNFQVRVGQTLQLTLLGHYSNGATVSLPPAQAGAYWELYPPGYASITQDGLLTGLRASPQFIEVWAYGQGQMWWEAYAQGTVLPDPATTIVELRVQPSQVQAAKGATVQLAVTAVYGDGKTVDVTAAAAGTFYDAQGATQFTVDANGLVKGLAAGGPKDLRISHKDVFALVPVTVFLPEAKLVSLEAVPQNLQLGLNGTAQLAVFGNYDDGTKRDLTTAPGTAYQTADATIASVSATGLVTGVKAGGPVGITAKVGGLTATTAVTVLTAALVKLTATPPKLDLNVGNEIQMQVLGAYSDGSSKDLTAASTGTTYTSSNPNAVTVSASGLLKAIAPGGPVTITVRNSGLQATITVTVKAPQLVEFYCEQGGITLPLQLQAPYQLKMIGRYTDGSTRDLSKASTGTTYRVDDPSVATVSADGGVIPKKRGYTEIIATNSGYETWIWVEVTDELPYQIEVWPDESTITAGDQVQLQVWAYYPSGGSADVTNFSTPWGTTTYTTSNALVATSSTGGLVTGNAEGTAIITVNLIGLTDTARIRVTPPVLDRLEIEPPSFNLEVGQTRDLKVWAIYTNETRKEVTAAANGTTYTVSGPQGVVSVSANGTVKALAQGGPVTVVARFGGYEAGATVSVLAPTLSDLQVTPASSTLNPGGTVQLKVTGVLPAGGTVDLTAAATGTTYAAGAANVTVSKDGLVTAIAVGPAVEITVTHLGYVRKVTVTVVTAVSLTGITVTPASAKIDKGATVQLKVEGTYSDGSKKDLTADPGTTYAAAPAGVVTISATGLVTGSAAGTVNAVARHAGFQAAAQIQVVAIQSLSVTPNPINVDTGKTVQITVTALMSDGTTRNVTSDGGSAYTMTDGNIASISQTGVVTGKAAGVTTLNVARGGVSVNVPVNVRGVKKLTVTPATATLDVGTITQLTVTAEFTDGTTQNVTSNSGTVYTSAPGGIVSVSATGAATGVAAGVATVTVTFQGAAAQAVLTVRSLVSLTVSPNPVSVNKGATASLTVTGNYSDGSTKNLTTTGGTTYKSNNVTVATVSGAGLITGVSGGATSVEVKSGGLTVTVPVTVIALTGISIAPANITLPFGQTQQLTVTGTYSDGSTKNLTATSTGTAYTTSPTGIVTVSAAGVVSAVKKGSATITASNGGFTAQASVNVTIALVSIAFAPPSASIAVGETANFTVTGTYSDGSTQNLTSGVTGTVYSATPGGLVTFPFDGQVLGTAVGTATVKATNGAISGTMTVTVTAAKPRIDSITPNQITAGSGNTPVTIAGANFQPGATVTVGAQTLTPTSVAGSSISVTIPAALLASAGTLNVTVKNPDNNVSNTAQITVVGVPTLTQINPTSGGVGKTIPVTLTGTNLQGVAVKDAQNEITITNVTINGAGTQITATFSIPGGATTGTHSIQATNAAGTAAINFSVVVQTNDLIVTSGQTVNLSGENEYDNIRIESGGKVVAQTTAPLTLRSLGEFTVAGTIEAFGAAGASALTGGTGDGGNGGSGGAGGGGGASTTGTGSPGGTGAPNGNKAANGSGSVTVKPGDGGGNGAGKGKGGTQGFPPFIPNVCGLGGGGGALGGAGGAGGGSTGAGTGAAGGSPGTGSTNGAGTGGGGGGACDAQYGGGGGGGGGAIILQARGSQPLVITSTGKINAYGGAGGTGGVSLTFPNIAAAGGGGGGSGGLVRLETQGQPIQVSGTISVKGGAGGGGNIGHGGGGGGGGKIILSPSGGGASTSGATLDVAGGAGGQPIALPIPGVPTGNAGNNGSQGQVITNP